MAKTVLFCFDQVLVATEFAGFGSGDSPEKRQLKFNVRERPGAKQALNALANAGFGAAVIAQGSSEYVSAVLKAVGLAHLPVVTESPSGIVLPPGMEPVGIVGCERGGTKRADMDEHAAVQIKSVGLPYADYSSVKPMLLVDAPSEPFLNQLDWCIGRLEKKYGLDRERLQAGAEQAMASNPSLPTAVVRFVR